MQLHIVFRVLVIFKVTWFLFINYCLVGVLGLLSLYIEVSGWCGVSQGLVVFLSTLNWKASLVYLKMFFEGNLNVNEY